MYAVSIISRPGNTFVLAFNRDEIVQRNAIPIAKENIGDELLFFPKGKNADSNRIGNQFVLTDVKSISKNA